MESELIRKNTTTPPDSWEFESADTQYLTHGIHRYSGKFIPQIPARVIADFTKPNDLVLDFFCGSGTTLLESAILGRKSVGIDLNPLAVLIARVKTTPISEDEIGKLVDRIEGEIDCAKQNNYKSFKSDPRLNDPWFCKWFNKEILLNLAGIHHIIFDLKKSIHRDLALVAFSDILRRVSNAHSGYPNVMFDKSKVVKADPANLFSKRLREVCEKVATLKDVPTLDVFKPTIVHGSSESISLKSNSVDAIISHPPYVASIPYAEYGALNLKWLGFEPFELEKGLTGGGRQKSDVLDRFKISYKKILSEGYRVLKPKGTMFLMVGNPTIRGELFLLDEYTKATCEHIGFKSIALRTRSGQNRRANKMGHETLLFFEK